MTPQFDSLRSKLSRASDAVRNSNLSQKAKDELLSHATIYAAALDDLQNNRISSDEEGVPEMLESIEEFWTLIFNEPGLQL